VRGEIYTQVCGACSGSVALCRPVAEHVVSLQWVMAAAARVTKDL